MARLLANGRLSIGRAVVLGAVLIALLPALILGGGLTLEVRSLMVSNLLERNLTAARSLAGYLDQIVTDHRQVLTLLAARLGQDPLSDPALVNQALNDTHDAYPLFARISLADPGGTVRYAVPAVRDGTSAIGLAIGDRTYFKTALQTRAPVVDPEIVVSRTTGTPQFVFAVPILDGTGAVTAMIVAPFALSTTREAVVAQDYGETGRTTIAAQDGTPIAQDDQDVGLRTINYSTQPIWPLLTAAETGQIASYLDHAGNERLGSFATVKTTGWKIWSSLTLEEVDAQVASTYRSILFWVVGAVALSVFLAFLFGRAVARPVQALQETALDIANGKLDERASETGFQEVSRLAVAINRMAASLQQALDDERNARLALIEGVRDYSSFADQVAAGNLSARVETEGRGELGRLGQGLNRMTESLGRLVSEIQAAVGRLASATAEILAATSQQVSATAEEATAVRQTAATVFEVRRTAESAARSTRHVTELAQRAEAVAATGRQSVAQSEAGSRDARERMEALAERILALSEQTQAIADINAAVGELAEKSNLLAVNAGIEAAKAGEAGRGFSVVAMEVKDLANRSKDATSQVRRILVAIQKSAQAAVMAAEQGVKVAGGGAVLARQSGEAIGALADSVTQASQAAQQISASASQQEAGMEQISLAMRNIEQSSAQTAAATKQVEQTARDLDTLAQGLSDLVRAMSTERTGHRA